MLDPTTLPRARPGASSMTAEIEINSSGADVPKATIVKLTINAGIPSRRAKFTAPLTNQSPAINRINNPNPTQSHSI